MFLCIGVSWIFLGLFEYIVVGLVGCWFVGWIML